MNIVDSSLRIFVERLCTKTRRDGCILDGFDHDFYLRFDFEEDPETPETKGTCDIYIEPIGEHHEGIRIKANAGKHDVLRILAAIGISRFPEHTRTMFYGSTSPLR